MGSFVFLAVLLGLLAVAFAVSTLWQHSRRLALGLALALPLAAAGLYYLKGEPAALDPALVAAPTTVEQAIAQLEKRIADEPENFEGRALLARAYMSTGQFVRARDTYASALKLNPQDSDLSVEYAEAQLRTSPDRRFPPQAVALLENAVAKNPQNQRALFFLGLRAMQEHQPAKAAATWEKLLPLLTPETAVALRQQIADARSAAGLPPLAAADTAAGPAVQIDVEIDPTLASLAQPGDTLFVFARTIDGVGPPVAAKRIVLDKLPLHLQLSDADSPMPAGKLSAQKQVLVMARLSKTGDATPASGDIEADPVQVEVQAGKAISLVLNRALP